MILFLGGSEVILTLYYLNGGSMNIILRNSLLFISLALASLSLNAMETNNRPLVEPTQIIKELLNTRTNAAQKKVSLRQAASLLYLQSNLFNLSQVLIPLANEMQKNQDARFLDANTPIQQIATAINNSDDPAYDIFVQTINNRPTLIVTHPQAVSLTLVLHNSLVNRCINDVKQFVLFNDLLDYYNQQPNIDSRFKQVIQFARALQAFHQFIEHLHKLPRFIGKLGLSSQGESVGIENFEQKVIETLLGEDKLSEFQEITAKTAQLFSIFSDVLLATNNYDIYIDQDIMQLINELENCGKKILEKKSYYNALYTALKRQFEKVGGLKQQWISHDDFLMDPTNKVLPDSLQWNESLKLYPEQGKNLVVNEQGAKLALDFFIKKHEPSAKPVNNAHGNSSSKKSPAKKSKTKNKTKKSRDLKNNNNENSIVDEDSVEQEISTLDIEHIELAEEIISSQQQLSTKNEEQVAEQTTTDEQQEPIKKKKKKKESKTESTIVATPSVGSQLPNYYDQRVARWFNNSFSQNESFESVMYHSFSSLIDNYLFTYGRTEERENGTRAGQMDTSYKLMGQVIFKGKVNRHVVFHATKDPRGVCYHRGLEWKPDDVFTIFSAANFWQIDLTYKANSLARTDLGDYFSPISNKPDELIKETPFHVEIRDNRLGVSIILYKV